VAVVPVFLLSLPRSGSTLVQRVLAAHDGVATAAEPWLLLPLLAPLREGLPEAGALQPNVKQALEDFGGQLPGGVQDYERAVHDLAIGLYQRAGGPGARLFVDKTPAYSLVIDELARVFGEAKLVFLWRNPLAVVSSVVETFAGGRWLPADYPLSLFTGLSALVAGYERHRKRSFSIRYEDLARGDEPTWRGLVDYLGVEWEASALERFGDVRLEGRMGDPVVANRDRALSSSSIDRWRTTLASPVRRSWCRRYVRWIGRERLSEMGYDLDCLLGELDAVQSVDGHLFADLADSASSLARAAAKSQLQRGGGRANPWRGLLSARGGEADARGLRS
jgi:Sulfotransferase family